MPFGDMDIVEALIKLMFLDYQLLMVVILVSTFGLLLVAEVKYISPVGIVHAPEAKGTVLLLMLAMTIIVNQLLGITQLTITILTTRYGTEQDV